MWLRQNRLDADHHCLTCHHARVGADGLTMETTESCWPQPSRAILLRYKWQRIPLSPFLLAPLPSPSADCQLPLCPHIPQIHFFCLGSTFICMYNKIVVSYTKVCQSICIIIWAYCMFTQNNNSNDNNRNNNNNKSNPSPFVYTMDQWEGV